MPGTDDLAKDAIAMTTLFGRLRLLSNALPQCFFSAALLCLSAAGGFAADGYSADSRYPSYDDRGYSDREYPQSRYDDRGYNDRGYDDRSYERPGSGVRRFDDRADYGRSEPARNEYDRSEFGGAPPRPRGYDNRSPRDDYRRDMSEFAPTRDDRVPDPSRLDLRQYDSRPRLDSRDMVRPQGNSRSHLSDPEYTDELPSSRPGRAPSRDFISREGRYPPRGEDPGYEGSEGRDYRDQGDSRRSDDRRSDFRRNRTGSGRHGVGRPGGSEGGRGDFQRGPRFDESLGAPGARDGRSDDRAPLETRPIPTSRQPNPEDNLTDSQKRQMKITARYGNPLVQRFVQSLSAQQGLRLYQESLQLIDTRHLQPSAYEARVGEAMANLAMAVQDPGFQQANGTRLSGQQVEGFRTAMSQVSQRRVQSGADAAAVMQSMMEVAGQAGIRPGAVAMEFVNGATDSLDKYSAFIPEAPAGRPSAAILDDHVVGIGVEIKPGEQGVLVKKVLPGGPAAEAGMQSGDLIVAVNGRELAGQSMDYAVDLITGQVGSQVQVAVVRGNGNPSTINLVRRNIAVASISDVQMLDRGGGLGYIKLEKFAKSSDEELEKAMWTLHQQGMQTLVLDLRGNPGGLLDVCERMADKFLVNGTIVSTKGRTQSDNTTSQARPEQTWKTALVVLIDEDSASASEILAAAIQDNGRGVIVGRKSYGKGTVQTHFPLQSVNGYLKLTTAKFYAPSGREMAGQGVEPDVYVPASQNGGGEVALQNDQDVIAAVKVARNPRTQELATNGGQRAR